MLAEKKANLFRKLEDKAGGGFSKVFSSWRSAVVGIFIVAVILMVYTGTLFFSIKHLPLTQIGLGMFRQPLVSGRVTSLFYRGITAPLLDIFYDQVQDPYPDDLFPLGGENYSQEYLYGGKAVICEKPENIGASRVCLRLASGRIIYPVFIEGTSTIIRLGTKFLEKTGISDAGLPAVTTHRSTELLRNESGVFVILLSDLTPRELLKKDAVNPYLDIREIRLY